MRCWKRSVCLLLAGVLALSSLTAADVKDLIAPNAEVKKVVGDCKFTEGPAFSPKGFLLFSDIPNSRIVKVEADGTSSDFLKPSGNANGLAFDAAGNLYACQGGSRRVVKITPQDGKVESLCDSYDGKPINSPNDLALDGHGGLYFSDPRYGADAKIDQPCMGVYYIDAAGKTTRVPLKLLDAAWLNGARIFMLEPRRLAARNAAHRMAETLGEEVGGCLGYQRCWRKKSISSRSRFSATISCGVMCVTPLSGTTEWPRPAASRALDS